MALLIEEECGTFAGSHPHNGYYAGDFSDEPVSATLSGAHLHI